MLPRRALVWAGMFALATNSVAAAERWSPRADCSFVPSGDNRLPPEAQSALVALDIEHRITQTLNNRKTASNYHGPDMTLKGRTYTAAVDLSVRCLDASSIKRLLSQLANHGFAAWYRENGKDGWKGANHIHAVWAAEPLKPQLRDQIKSWLNGRTGLVGNGKYEFWQPSAEELLKVSAQYEASKALLPGDKGAK